MNFVAQYSQSKWPSFVREHAKIYGSQAHDHLVTIYKLSVNGGTRSMQFMRRTHTDTNISRTLTVSSNFNVYNLQRQRHTPSTISVHLTACSHVIKWHEQALLLKFNLFDIYYEKLSINKLSFSHSCAVWCKAHAQRDNRHEAKNQQPKSRHMHSAFVVAIALSPHVFL